MAADFVHSVIVEEQDPAADAILNHELPVNPLSGLLLHIKPLNETSTISNYDSFAALLDAINTITISWRGIALFEATGRDAYMLLRHRWNRDITSNNQVNTDNDRRSIILPILFGRYWGDPEYALPATRAGELVMQLDVDVADTGYDDLRYGIEALELPKANPSDFFRVTTISQTFAATSFNDIVLPIGHDILGILCWMTTAYAGATPTPGLGRLEVLKDGVQTGYSSTDVEVGRAVAALTGMTSPWHNAHTHWVIVDDTVDVDTQHPERQMLKEENYLYLDYDFDRTGKYALDTKGANRCVLRSQAEVAEAMRVMPIEKTATSLLK